MCNLDCACLGNHDLVDYLHQDFGLEHCTMLNSKTNFPWLLSNLVKLNGGRFVGTKEFHIIEDFGFRFGLMGLIEMGWISTLNCIDLDEVIFEDFVKCGNRLAKELREVYKCDFVIALTHMRNNNDLILTNECQGIDFILGGHDHVDFLDKVFDMQKFPHVLYVKSGTDFQNLSEIVVRKCDPSMRIEESPSKIDETQVVTNQVYTYRLKDDLLVSVTKHDITKEVEPNPAVLKHVESYDLKLAEKMKKILFKCIPEVNLKFSFIRTHESSFANVITDIVRKEASADCCLLSSGSLRADTIYSAGKLYSYGELFDIYSLEKELCLIEITGEDIYQGLECGVSKYPTLDGRFPQVALFKLRPPIYTLSSTQTDLLDKESTKTLF